MPAIRLVYNAYKDPITGALIPKREEWVRVLHPHTDKDGYLQLFSIYEDDNNSPTEVHLLRHDYPLMDLAVGIFGAGTALRSAKGLLEAFAKAARKENWTGKAGAIGFAFGSAAILYEFLKTRPFDQEGYYRGDGTLFLGRKIHSKTRSDYDPRENDTD